MMSESSEMNDETGAYVECEPFCPHDVIVRSTFLLQVTEKSKGVLSDPVSYGSGFIVDCKGNKYFVTADHVLHLDHYGPEKKNEILDRYDVSLFNNYTIAGEFVSTAITPLSDFFFLRAIKPIDPHDDPSMDVCVCELGELQFRYPMLTEQILLQANIIVPAGRLRLQLTPSLFSVPDTNSRYCVFGNIRPNLVDGIRLDRKQVLIENIRYIMPVKGFLLFNAPETITDTDDWRGLSGAPIFSSDGAYCVGVFCSVNEGTKMIFAAPISAVSMVIDIMENLKRIV